MSKKNSPTIKTLIACSHSLYGEGVSKILSEDKKVDVVSVASTLIDLIESSKQKNFDVLILDVDLKGLNLNKILALVKKNKNAKVILLIDNSYSENLLINGIRSGIRGYVQKNVDASELIQSVKAVNDGELWAERKLMGKVVDGSI